MWCRYTNCPHTLQLEHAQCTLHSAQCTVQLHIPRCICMVQIDRVLSAYGCDVLPKFLRVKCANFASAQSAVGLMEALNSSDVTNTPGALVTVNDATTQQIFNFSTMSVAKPRNVRLRPSSAKVCAYCKAPGAKKKCHGCMQRTYCNKKCQKKDWKQTHRMICEKLQQVFVPPPAGCSQRGSGKRRWGGCCCSSIRGRLWRCCR